VTAHLDTAASPHHTAPRATPSPGAADHRRVGPGGGPGDPLSAVAWDIERTTRRVGHLEGLLRDLAGAVTELAVCLTDREGGAGPASWLAASGNPATATDLLADLVDWLGRIYLRYPGATLPSCWLWHPAAVEELLWLRHAHHAAYDGPRASWARVADWHERQRPGVVRRISTGLGSCELLCHAAGGEQDRPPPTVPLVSASDALARWAAAGLPGAPPPPTDDQLAEADHVRAATRRR
jgi:hypothetical protein